MFVTRPAYRMLSTAIVATALFWPTPGRSDEFDVISSGETSLVMKSGEIHVQLNEDGCDAGFESACSTVLQRSEYLSKIPRKHGDRVSYAWEIKVPKDFTYNAVGGYLRAVRFVNGAEESVLSFLIDAKTGYNVSRKTCFGPEGFGAWHAVKVLATWDATKKKGLKDKTPGDLRIICDGKEVLKRQGRPNIGEDEMVWVAFGLAGSLNLAEGDNAAVVYRNIKIETR